MLDRRDMLSSSPPLTASPLSCRTSKLFLPPRTHRTKILSSCSSRPMADQASQQLKAKACLTAVKAPVLLFDVMGTLVRDPFHQDVPAFFGISMKELLASKHPTAWIEFEKGLISEEELIGNFFIDKRRIDCKGLKECMTKGYTYLEGIEPLLGRLKSNGYQMHAFSNYPLWYKLIEDKLELSKYLMWTSVSCYSGKRKPDREAYIEVAKQLEMSTSDIIFIDDQMTCWLRSRNVEAAIEVGMTGLIFESAAKLERELLSLGLVF